MKTPGVEQSVTTTSSLGLPSLAATLSLFLAESLVPSAPATLTARARPAGELREGDSLGRRVEQDGQVTSRLSHIVTISLATCRAPPAS